MYLGLPSRTIFLNGLIIDECIDFSVDNGEDGLSSTNLRIRDIFGLFSVGVIGRTGEIVFSEKRKNPNKKDLSRLISSISRMSKFEISRNFTEVLHNQYGLYDDLSKYKLDVLGDENRFPGLARPGWIVREKRGYEVENEDENFDCVDLSYDRDYGYLEICGYAFPPPPRRDDLNKFCLRSRNARTIILVDRRSRTKVTTKIENSIGKEGTQIYIDMPSMYFAPFTKFFLFARRYPESIRNNDRFFYSSEPKFIGYNHLLDFFGKYTILSFENRLYFNFTSTTLTFHSIDTGKKYRKSGAVMKIFPEDIEEV